VVLVEVLQQKVIQYVLDLDFTFRPSCMDLALSVICQLECTSLVMVWDSKDEVGPSSKIAMLVKGWVKYLVALRFSIG
jgi:hypothetical protein